MNRLSSTISALISRSSPRIISRVVYVSQLPQIHRRQLCSTPEQQRQDRYNRQVAGFMFASGMTCFVATPTIGLTLAVLFDNADIFLGMTGIGFSCGLYIGILAACPGPLPPTKQSQS